MLKAIVPVKFDTRDWQVETCKFCEANLYALNTLKPLSYFMWIHL